MSTSDPSGCRTSRLAHPSRPRFLRALPALLIALASVLVVVFHQTASAAPAPPSPGSVPVSCATAETTNYDANGSTSTSTSNHSVSTCVASKTGDNITMTITANIPVPEHCPYGNPNAVVTHGVCASTLHLDDSADNLVYPVAYQFPGLFCPFSAPGTPEPQQTAFDEVWIGDSRSSITCTLTFDATKLKLYQSQTVGVQLFQRVEGATDDQGLVSDRTDYIDEFTVGFDDTLTAAFTSTPTPPTPGVYLFDSSSSDPQGSALRDVWDFGDGSTSTSALPTHTYTKPGTYTSTLTVTNDSGKSSSVSHDIVVAAPKLETDVSFVDGHGVVLDPISPKLGDSVNVRLTVSASADGVGSVSNIGFGGDAPTVSPTASGGSPTVSPTASGGMPTVSPTASGGTPTVSPTASGDALTVSPTAAASIGAPVPALPSPFTLKAGDSASFVFPATVLTGGVAHYTSTPVGVDDSGATVTGTTGQRSYSVSALTIAMSVDPPTFTQDEDAKGPKPKDVTVTETITNPTDGTFTNVSLRSLEPVRVDQGQLLAVVYKSGANPDSISGLDLPDIAAGGHDTVTAVYTVTDDGKVDFTSVVTAADSDGSTTRALGTTRLEADPKYYLGFTSRVVTPATGLLPAGTPITIQGTVTNLSDSDSEDVGPMFAQVAGNAGLQGLTYDGVGIDPKALQAPPALTLDPGESKDFTLKVLTSYSEPVVGASPLTGAKPASGGTRATITFTPYATVHRDDGTTFTTDPTKDVRTSDADLTKTVSIDDSIAIPEVTQDVVVGGILYGGINGIWNAASGMVTGLIGLPQLSASTLFAVSQYQDQVWSHFTEAQKEQFAQDSTSMIVPVLEANATLAAQGVPALEKKASDFVYNYFTKAANDWQVGNYAQTVALYSELASDTIGQVAIPAALGTLAKSGSAVQVVQAAEEADNAELATDAAGLSGRSTPAAVMGSLTTIPAGAQPTLTQIANLFGITSEELARLQAYAAKYDFLMVVRSRAASSIDWIKDFAALLKPEALKIKTVSDMDVKLGYDAKYAGSLVFKEPVPLAKFRASGGDLDTLVKDFVESKGFQPGTSEYDNAISRMNLRMTEWNKYAETYQAWSKRGWIDTSFNWTGNAMNDPIDVAARGKYAGFKLQPTGEPNEFVVKMLNGKTGEFVPVTGDIDPIAFTHTDGTPLTVEEHAALLNDLRNDALLLSQHGESATYVNGGVDFIESQFKPNEAALMIGPGDQAPRIVRFNKAQSIWNSATDYHLVWDGQFVDAGATPPTDGALNINFASDTAPAAAATPEAAAPLPGDGSTNVGRCAMTYNASGGTPLFMSAAGTLDTVAQNGAVSPSPLESTCFSPGPPVPVSIAPVTTIGDPGQTTQQAQARTAGHVASRDTPAATGAVQAGQREIPVQTGDGVAGENPTSGFAVGQQVAIDPGTAQAETGTISGFGSIVLAAPLRYSHPAGALIVVTAAAPAAEPADPGAGTTAPTATTTPTDPTTTNGGTPTAPPTTPTGTTPTGTGAGGSLTSASNAPAAHLPTGPGSSTTVMGASINAPSSDAALFRGILPFTGLPLLATLGELASLLLFGGIGLAFLGRRRRHGSR